MKKSKKLMFYIATLLVALCVCACSSKKDSGKNDKEVNNEQTEKKDEQVEKKDEQTEQKKEDNNEVKAEEKKEATTNKENDSAKVKKMKESLLNKEWHSTSAKESGAKENEFIPKSDILGKDCESDVIKFDANGGVIHQKKGEKAKLEENKGKYNVSESNIIINYDKNSSKQEKLICHCNKDGSIKTFDRVVKNDKGEEILIKYDNKKDSPELFYEDGQPLPDIDI